MSRRSLLYFVSVLCFVSACMKMPLPLGQGQKVQGTKHVSYKHTGPIQRPERVQLSFDSRLAGGYQGAKYFIPFASENSGFKTQSENAALQVRPILDCVSQDNGTYRAYFSYKNQTEAVVNFAQGIHNRLYDPDTHQEHETQALTSFPVGRSAKYPDSVLQVPFASGKRIAWTLDGQTVIASQDSPKCGERPSAVHFQAGEPDSLGLLYPWMPGSKNIAQPETKTAYISLNQNYPAAVVTGQVMLSTETPQALETILQDYNARIVSGPDSAGFYLVSPDMTRVDVSALEDNLKLLNEDIEDPNYIIHSASFGGLESARTFAFLVELMQRKLVNGIGFNWVMEPAVFDQDAYPQTSKTVETRLIGEGDAATQTNIGRRFANVIKAWDYGLGYSVHEQRSIRVAVIDSGFGGLWDHMEEGRELHGQILVDKGGYVTHGSNQFLPWTNRKGDDGITTLFPEENDKVGLAGSHGTNVASVIAAKINDKQGFAGVAPAAKIIPIQVSTEWWPVSIAIEAAVEKGADVINLSICAGVFSEFTESWLSLLATSENGYTADAFAAVKNALAKAESQNTIVVVSAGNKNWNVKHGLWGRDNEYGRVFKNIIIVGGLQDDEDGFFSRYPEYGSLQNPVRGKAFPFPKNLKRWVGHPHFEPVPSRLHVRESSNEQERQSAKTAYANTLESTYNKGTIESIYTKDDFGSNWGDNVDIWAPAASQVLLKPDENRVGLTSNSGTSIAAPFIAGVIALMKAQRINLSRDEIKSLFDDMSFSNQYQDFYKWQKPVEMTDTEIEAYVLNGGQYKPASEFKCGNQARYLCGDFNLMPPKFIERDGGQILLAPEEPNIEVKTPNVPKIIRYLGGEATAFIVPYQAILEKHGDELYLRTDGLGTLRIHYQGLTAWEYLKHFYALDLNDEPVSWNALLNQPVFVRGRNLDHANVNVLQMYQLSPFDLMPSPEPSQDATPHCVTDIIVSNKSDWRWYPENKPYQSPAIVPYFNKLEFKTLPHIVGQPESLPVWSELTEKGVANCTNCEVDLWHDYTLLSGYRVESAKLFAKADDEMHVFLNAEYITTVKDKLLQHPDIASYDLPLSYFQNAGRTKEVPIMLRGVNKVSPPHHNFAGIMARIEVKRCAE